MPRSVLDEPRFRGEAAAYAYVEAMLWTNGRVCPKCGVVDRSGPLMGKSTRIGVYKCYACRKPFTVKVGTIFESSHVPLHIWLQAIHLMCSSKEGFSANQFARVLGVDIKTGWFLGHRIRLAMDESGSAGPLGGTGTFVEVDETYTVYRKGKPTWLFTSGVGWRRQASGADRVPVVTLVERGGRVRSKKVDNVTAATLRSVVLGTADTKSRLMSDELRAYRRIGGRFARHDAVNHGEEEWAQARRRKQSAHQHRRRLLLAAEARHLRLLLPRQRGSSASLPRAIRLPIQQQDRSRHR
jgi:transposase-like protein